jgi:hypothetical protein
VPGWQLPPAHVSPVVQALPSLHEAVLLVKTQPVAGLQVSVVQTLLSLQTIAAPLHEPPLHVSPEVQAFPSLQEFVLLVKTQPVAGLHESVVQTLLSLQTIDVPPHEPPLQESPVVHAFPSSHAVPSGCDWQKQVAKVELRLGSQTNARRPVTLTSSTPNPP